LSSLAAGISIGKKQKPWSEMTEEEKGARKLLIAGGTALFVLGLVVFLARSL